MSRAPTASAAIYLILILIPTLMMASGAALSQTSIPMSPVETCLSVSQNLSLQAALPRTAGRLKRGGTLKIVAIGSSSTFGLWVFGPATYPAMLQHELARLHPTVEIEMVNSGQVGDTIPGTISRFSRDVFAHKPDLVIWQLGTNDVAWGETSIDGLQDQVAAGVRELKSSTDVILMDQQYAPQVLASSQHEPMQRLISAVARQERVGLFSRFELMQRSIEAGLSPKALVSWDGLHNSAAGYECIGRALARAISEVTQ